MSENSAQKTGQRQQPRVRIWVVILAIITVAAGYFYHLHQQEREVSVNTFYFRTLQEVATEFNNNLDQLVRLRKYKESTSTILSIFPSFSPDEQETAEIPEALDGHGGEGVAAPEKKSRYVLGANRIKIEQGRKSFSVDIQDVLPAPGNDFVLYMIVDENNRVLSSSGGVSGLSIIDTEVVSRAIQAQQNQDWLKLARQQALESPNSSKSLPGHSVHIDLELTTGKSRLFVLPFHLHHDFELTPYDSKEEAGGKSVESVPLYLLGVQPERVIKRYESKRWNLSLLLLSLVALIFFWTVARLLMLSRHQPLGNSFYRTILFASYLTFVMLVALLLAVGQRSSETARKQESARELVSGIRAGVAQDLFGVFNAMKPYHGFYRELLLCGRTMNQDPPAGALRLSDNDAYTGCLEPPTVPDSSHKILSKRGKCLEVSDHQGEGLVHFITSRIDPDPPVLDDKTLPPFSLINVFPSGSTVTLAGDNCNDTEVNEWFDVEFADLLPAGGKLLSVFLMDENGQQVLPMFYYTENNKPPASYSLAHRDYFRRVRDHDGWSISLCASADDVASVVDGCAKSEPRVGQEGRRIELENFYIQRLLNINTGTRGSTLGVPLDGAKGDPVGHDSSEAYFLGADIVLPSLSLTEWLGPTQPQDMVMMVVDRISGQVLYHMDDRRSMVENLYQSGSGAAGISRTLRAGLFDDPIVPGYYHGASGDFLASTLPVSQWALLVFIPEASTDSLMTNTFLADTAVMGMLLLALAALLSILGRWCDTSSLKADWGIPPTVNRHGVMLFSSILIASIYFGYRVGAVIGQAAEAGALWSPSLGLSLVAIAVAIFWGYIVLQGLRERNRLRQQIQGNAARGTAGLIGLFLLGGLGLVAYLQLMGDQPGNEISRYYGKLQDARLNQENAELREIALTRYPNSIKRHRRDPLTLLPITAGWRCELDLSDSLAMGEDGGKRRHVFPAHVGPFSQYSASTGPLEWVVDYLLKPRPYNRSGYHCDELSMYEAEIPGGMQSGAVDTWNQGQPIDNGDGETRPAGHDTPALLRFLVVMTFAFLLLSGLWYFFIRRVFLARLVGLPGLIEHLQHIVHRNVPERAYAPRAGLVLDLHCERHTGDDLSALLSRYGGDRTSQRAEDIQAAESVRQEAMYRGVWLLLKQCPWLKSPAEDADRFPGVNIDFEPLSTGVGHGNQSTEDRPGLRLHLSELDICLSQADLRGSLLRLIRDLKALCLAGEVAELRLSLGFHSYEALLLKAHISETERDPMSELEFALWAEVLMDFTVDLPQDLTREIDPGFVQYECGASGLLRGLPRELLGQQVAPVSTWRQRRRWLQLDDVDKTGREWASINCILLKAGALFRQKWETCSSAEKLALYYLARKKRVNTANAQLLEQLALQGLIRVDHGRIRVVNNSFAYFARHAEDAETLRRLVQIGEVGAWKDYRLPVTLVILLILGGIAFTSGSSLYIIAASTLALLGTIGSLTSSAYMIRENLR